jgi:hypothetical protein
MFTTDGQTDGRMDGHLYAIIRPIKIWRAYKNRFPNENGPVPLMFSLPHTGFIFIWSFLDIFYQCLVSDSVIQKYFSNKCVGIFATIFYVKSRNTKGIIEGMENRKQLTNSGEQRRQAKIPTHLFEKYFWIIESDTKHW